MVNKLKGIGQFIIKYIKNNKIKTFVILFVVLISLIITIANSLASLTPVKSITVTSVAADFDNSEPGSYKVTKSYEWIGPGKIKVSSEIDTAVVTGGAHIDVLLAVDTSDSATQEEFNDLKTKLTNYASYVAGLDNNTKVGMVAFNSSYNTYAFTHDGTTLTNNINSLTRGVGTSYYAAFKGINEMLDTYTPANNYRKVVVVFLVNGESTKDRGSELYQYRKFVADHPNVEINALYYQTNKQLTTLDNYFDDEMVVTPENLEFSLKALSTGVRKFTWFTYDDVFNDTYFTYENDSLTSNVNTVTISDDVITGDMRNSYFSGSKAKIEYILNLKSQYLNSGGNYELNPTGIYVYNTDLDITTKEIHADNLVVGNNYNVTYEANSPSGCTAQGNFGSTWHGVGTTVTLQSKPTCSGYKFRGWEIITEGVNKQNEDYFVMPDKDVVIRATWSKVNTMVSMDGDIQSFTLYGRIADSSLGLDTNIKFANEASTSNGQGVYTRAGTENDKYPIYYYRGSVSNNNVIFGGLCWKIIRTTDTGGVKMIYNGVPNSSNQCVASGENTTATRTVFNYDVSSSGSYPPVVNTGYMYNNSINHHTVKLEKHWYDVENAETNTLEGYWYMTAASTAVSAKTGIATSLSGTQYYYATNGSWSNNAFSLSGASKKKQTATTKINNVYTCFNSSSGTATCNPGYYVVGYSYSATSSKNTVYYITLSPGETKTTLTSATAALPYYFSKSVSYNSTTGMYTLTNPQQLSPPYDATSQTNIVNLSNGVNTAYPYACLDPTQTTCSTVVYYNQKGTANYQKYTITGLKLSGGATDQTLHQQLLEENKYYFGSDVEYSNGTYTLVDPIEGYLTSSDDISSEVRNSHHYFCDSGTSCASVNYAYVFLGTTLSYYTFSSGDKIESLFDNDTASEVKKAIDSWYENTLFDLTNSIEDTIYCNKRTFSTTGGLDKNGDIFVKPIWSSDTSMSSPSLTCPSSDSFTVGSLGNGKLNYPIGLLTSDELALIGKNTTAYLNNGLSNTTMSPVGVFGTSTSSSTGTVLSGSIGGFGSSSTAVGMSVRSYVRPVISLKGGALPYSGVGSSLDPYVIDTLYSIQMDASNATLSTNSEYVKSGTTITINANASGYEVVSFKLNGVIHAGKKFKMPLEDVIITDVVVGEQTTIESEHYPYPSSASLRDYGTVTYAGATKLSIQLTYGTYLSSDKVFLYSGSTQKTSYYGSDISPRTVTYTMTGNTVTFKLTTDGTDNNYYGFKAVVTPIY